MVLQSRKIALILNKTHRKHDMVFVFLLSTDLGVSIKPKEDFLLRTVKTG